MYKYDHETGKALEGARFVDPAAVPELAMTPQADKKAPAPQSQLPKSVSSTDILAALDQVLTERKAASPDSSYVASLYHKGINKILEKVGEETTEAIIAAKDVKIADEAVYEAIIDDTAVKDLVYEVADVWFHTMVTLAWFNIPSTAVIRELARRFGLSGIDEKNAR